MIGRQSGNAIACERSMPRGSAKEIKKYGRSEHMAHTLGRHGRPRPRTGIPAARRYSPAVTRCTPVARPIRVSVQPSRPSASTCCCLSCSKTLPIPAKDYTSIAFVNVSAGSINCRFLGVD